MPRTAPPLNRFVRLARWGSRGAWQSHVAALAAGWLSFISKAPLPPSRALTGRELALGVLVLLGLFVGLPPVLVLLQPALRALGHLGASELCGLGFLALNLWRYVVGRKLVAAVRAMPLPLETTAQPSNE